MKSTMRVIAVFLWFAPVVVCVGYSLFEGFTHENYGAAGLIHNGLNPYVYAHEEWATGISVILSAVVVGYVSLAKKSNIGDSALLCFVILSYVFAAIQFLKNFHPG